MLSNGWMGFLINIFVLFNIMAYLGAIGLT